MEASEGLGTIILVWKWYSTKKQLHELRDSVSFHSNRMLPIKLRSFSSPMGEALGLVENSYYIILALRNIKFWETSSSYFFLLFLLILPLSLPIPLSLLCPSPLHLFLINKPQQNNYLVLLNITVLCLTIHFLFVDISENSF